MNPGRELDALIAEKVMDLSLSYLPDARDPNSGVFVQELSDGDRYAWDASEREWAPVPPYSTSIAAAWEIVEKMLAYNPFWNLADNLEFDLSPTGPKGWQCNFGDDRMRAFAATAPHAICLAALEAISRAKD